MQLSLLVSVAAAEFASLSGCTRTRVQDILAEDRSVSAALNRSEPKPCTWPGLAETPMMCCIKARTRRQQHTKRQLCSRKAFREGHEVQRH